jgi:hypothetical protein
LHLGRGEGERGGRGRKEREIGEREEGEGGRRERKEREEGEREKG